MDRKLVIIGGSAGSLSVILSFLKNLNNTLGLSIVIVVHRKASTNNILPTLLQQVSTIPLLEIDDKMELEDNHIYLAPADFHLLFEDGRVMSLDRSEKFNYSRPSIDVTFRSAAEIFQNNLTGILLSGANADGVEGLMYIKRYGGKVWIQDPQTAEVDFMPRMAMDTVDYDFIVTPEELAERINQL